MKELLETIRPMAEVTKQLSEKNDELERENHHLLEENTRLDHTLKQPQIAIAHCWKVMNGQ